ncbi:hypothetical protein [Acetonema longum]|uniref:Uncharacterized protein n=1 Tax=Acetonema longum DSM 6540 TaxID=1009370 RepID=F7NK81_9FIRM|nr:hypothetical protein [Acetonema longum]EGO63522.1 hypothetical protein ALO_12471 [Acetonema longum DSM 6540]
METDKCSNCGIRDAQIKGLCQTCYKKAYRQSFIDKGICPVCRKNPLAEGLATCEQCRERIKRVKRKEMANNGPPNGLFCRYCDKPLTGHARVVCDDPECLRKNHNKKERENYENRKPQRDFGKNITWISKKGVPKKNTIYRDKTPLLKISKHNMLSFNPAANLQNTIGCGVGDRIDVGIVGDDAKTIAVKKGKTYKLTKQPRGSALYVVSKLTKDALVECGIKLPATYKISYMEEFKMLICELQEGPNCEENNMDE